MSQLAVYGLGIAFGFIAWGLVTVRYIWPQLRRRPRSDALRPAHAQKLGAENLATCSIL